MCKISRILNYFVFIVTTLAIAGVFYEGMALEWFDIVGVFIMAMDVSFIISTLINLFVCKKNMDLYQYLFSSYDSSSIRYEAMWNFISNMVTCFLVFLYLVCIWNSDYLQ